MVIPLQATRVFGERDQQEFARVSGDCNPMHLDAVAARRTQAGATVVHGVHLVLWALDVLAECGALTESVAEIAVRFRKFVYVGSPANVRWTESDHGLTASIASHGVDCLSLHIRYGASTASLEPIVAPAIDTSTPLVLDLPQLFEYTGRLSARFDATIATLFPHAVERLGATRVQGIGLISTLVGVVCPGLHSIFDGFTIALAPVVDGETEVQLTFAVTSLDERFRFVTMAITGSGFSGSVEAFVRHPPVEQSTLAQAAAHVDAHEFDGITALIVGGSRGLGAISARLLVAGGARVIVTYRVGRTEALALVDELGSERCRILPFDATQPAVEQLAALPWKLDQIYYFATTQIYREQAAFFSFARFIELCRVYVEGFADLVAAAKSHLESAATILYPSTVFVAARPRKMTEYAMAKAAGELLCEDLNRVAKNTTILVKRLPRVLTDQTASVIPTEAEDPLGVMLPVLRTMTALLARS